MTQQTNRRTPDPLRPPPASSNWSDTEPGPPTTWTQTYPPPPPPKPARGASIVRILGGLLLVGLIVAGVLVGLRLFRPAESAETGDARAQTLEIARFYAVDGNADAARLALAELPVANDEQWLLFATEGALSDPAVDDATRRALVSLALELGLSEAGLVAYAEANGLVQAAAPESATVAAAMNAPVAGSAPAAQPAATAPQPEADAAGSAIAGAAAVTTTAPISSSAATTSALPLTSTAAGPAPAAGSEPAAAAPTAAPTAAPAALTATTTQLINLRSGPGTDFPTAGSMSSADTATVLARSPAGDWLQVRLPSGATAWVFTALVTPSGPVDTLAVAADIPAAPATATPAAVAPAPTVAPAAPAATAAPAAPAATAAPAEQPTATPAPAAGNPSDQPTFRLVERRMWSKEENGACAGQHLLRISVVDAAGNPLNGITLQGIYTGFQATTGDQGKGDGRMEFDLYGSGEAFKVIRNNDGREAVSDEAGGFTTKSLDIDVPTLIGGGYCTNEQDCQVFYNSYGCTGHHSWEAKFQRNY